MPGSWPTRPIAWLSLLVLLVAWLPGEALSCRCRPLTLSGHFAAADHVFFATLRGVSPLDGDIALAFEVHGSPYKGQLDRTWRTAAQAAACGLPLAVGGRYLVFAVDGEEAGQARVGTCDGSRRLDDNGDVPDFVDVPGRHVPRQLEAMAAMQGGPLSGLPGADALRGLLVAGTETLALAPRAGGEAAETVPVSALLRREVAYEEPAVVVTAQAQEGWYRVRLGDRSAWVHAPAAVFHRYPEVAVNRLNYLTAAWDGVLWPQPGAGLPFRLARDGDEVPARVLGVTWLAGHPWLQVDVLGADPCQGGTPASRAGGYLPAYGIDGEPTAWFHARGC